MFRQLLRRFVLPQMLVIGILAAAIVIVAAIQIGHTSGSDEHFVRHIVPVLWVALMAMVAAAIATTVAAWRFTAGHVEDIAHLFAGAVPAAAAAELDPRRYRDNEGDAEAKLHDVARTFSDLMDVASKDQAHLLAIISSMSDGLVATDHQQRIVLTNEAAREQLLFRTERVKGKQLWEVIPIEQVLKAVTEVSLTGQQKTVGVGPVNGRYLDVTVTRLPLRPAGFVVISHDVTETMRYEELRKEFVANVSHELRTPLTVIKGYVETLKDGALDDRERAVQYLGTVERHTEQLTNLVDDLLNLSRLDAMSAVPNPRPVHLGKLAGKVVETLTPAAQKKGHKLVLLADDGVRPVIGNVEYLERAIANLVENAIKYTPADADGMIRVLVRADTGGDVVLEVNDNGMGIPLEDQERIFERFYRVDRSRSRDAGGTGLGLSIVKHIVQSHGGEIEVESVPGAGSTFRMRFAPDRPAGQQSASPDAGNTAA